MPITIYGIKNCDTMKKARSWLDKNGIEYTFHDYKTAGIDRDRSPEPRRDDIQEAAGKRQKQSLRSQRDRVDA